MNQDKFMGQLHEITGKVKAKWGDLTDDEILEAQGRFEELAGKIQKKYGGTREDIMNELGKL
jgi:uncharacterized protein YjbJ (UPF0337 family)